MSKDLQILRLKDDLQQAGKEIQHLQTIVDNLVSDQKTHNASNSRLAIENNSLRLERDELRNVIKIADDGIGDMNNHWKQKFFIWRETESELLKELSENNEKLQEMRIDFDSKAKKHTKENKKLVVLVTMLKGETIILNADLEKRDEQIRDMTEKLRSESLRSVNEMFITRDNEVLCEKVRVLEAKVHSFYDESMKQSRDNQYSMTYQDAERDLDTVVSNQKREGSQLKAEITKLKEENGVKKQEICILKEEVSRLSCTCESQMSKMKQLRKHSDTSNDSAAEAALNLKREREKLKKASEVINELTEKLTTADKLSVEVKTELGMKARLLDEKDAQTQHFKRIVSEQDEKLHKTVSDLDNYKHTLSLAETEKKVLQENLKNVNKKLCSAKKDVEKLSTEKEIMLGELDKTNRKVHLLSKQFKESEMESGRCDKALVHSQQKLVDHEVELTEKSLQIEELLRDNKELSLLLGEMRQSSEEVLKKEELNSYLKAKMERLNGDKNEKIVSLEALLDEKAHEFKCYKADVETRMTDLIQLGNYSDKSTSNVSLNSAMLVDSSTMTDLPLPSFEEFDTLQLQMAKLKKVSELRDKKMNFAETELKRQAGSIVEKQCIIDKLSFKCKSLKSAKYSSSTDDKKCVSKLEDKILELESGNSVKEIELEKLRAAEVEGQKREELFWELSEMVKTLQLELDNKHTNTLKEVEFYRDRLLQYEKRPLSVNKSINTSLPEIEEEASECCLESNFDVDLSDLEVVMDKLKCTYEKELDDLHKTFRDRVESCNEEKWIDLMNK